MSLKSFIEPEECRRCKGRVCVIGKHIEPLAQGLNSYHCKELDEELYWIQVVQKFMTDKEYKQWRKGR